MKIKDEDNWALGYRLGVALWETDRRAVPHRFVFFNCTATSFKQIEDKQFLLHSTARVNIGVEMQALRGGVDDAESSKRKVFTKETCVCGNRHVHAMYHAI